MKLTVDQEADALRFRLADVPVTESGDISPGVIVGYDESTRSSASRLWDFRSAVLRSTPLDFQFKINSKMQVD